MREVTIEPLRTLDSPRELLAGHFKSIGELPIRGGWGYSREDAVVIDRDDPIVPRDQPFDGVDIEYVFIEKRTFEELIIFRPKGRQFSGIRRELIDQRTVVDNGRRYDVLRFDVTALPDADWDALKAEWEGPDGIQSPDFDHEAHQRRREAATIHYVAEYWFDITSFFGRYD